MARDPDGGGQGGIVVTTADEGRHLDLAALMEHWANGVPVVIPIAGAPSLRVLIDPPRSRVTLRAPVSPETQVPASAWSHIGVSTLVDGGIRYLEISTTDERLVADGYAMLMAVADRIQIDGLEPMAAFGQTLATWQSILAMRVRMSLEKEIGLYGELLVVAAVLATGVAQARSWRGGLREEHDFGFSDADLEVKTTIGERRQHWIHGLAQMVGTRNTPLWMLSLQITRAAGGQGQNMPELIDSIFEMAPNADRIVVEQNLVSAGWHEDQRDLFAERWRLRTAPLALRVDDDFPRLTPELLAKAGINLAPLRQVAYEIDVTDRAPTAPQPPTVRAITERMKDETHD